MRPTRTSVAIAAVLAAVVVASTAQGASTARPWLAGYGSWSTYSMQDVNHDDVPLDLVLPFFAVKMGRDELHSGPGLGFEFGVDLPQPLTLGFGYERLFATYERSSTTYEKSSDDPGDTSRRVIHNRTELKFPANAFYGLVEIRSRLSGLVEARLGMAAGLVALAPVPRIALSGRDAGPAAGPDGISLMLTGTGPMFRVYATGECRVGPEFVLFASAGYRFAKVNEPRIHKVVVSDFPIDYSGVATRVGIKLALVK